MKNISLYIFLVIGTLGFSGNTLSAMCPQAKQSTPNEQPTVVIKPNVPNPFFEETKIRFFISSPQHVKVNLFNILGVKVATLLQEDLNGGDHEFTFKKPADLPDGIYIYSVETPTVTRSKRMIIRR